MENTRFNYLFERYFKGLATPEESNEFLDIVEDDLNKEQVQALMEVYWNSIVTDEEVFFSETQRDHMYTAIFNADRSAGTKPTYKLWPRIAVAVAMAAIIFGAGLFYFNINNRINSDEIVAAKDIAPGKQGATLILANGKKIRLSDASNGELAKESGLSISKTADGQIVYEMKHTRNQVNKINTLSTAKGETYQVRLPDGSLVVLNAASSLTYATSLNERGERKVKLIGEAYMEVAKDKKHPFIVESRNQQIEVLGTHFNVNAYEDEDKSRTTLLEGSVKVSVLAPTNGELKSTILKPGEQSVITSLNQIAIRQADVNEAIAWKNGKFIFEDQPIENIMRILARWYNVEVQYEEDVKKIPFTASISKYDNISKILEKMSRTQNIKFKIDGRRITVMK